MRGKYEAKTSQYEGEKEKKKNIHVQIKTCEHKNIMFINVSWH